MIIFNKSTNNLSTEHNLKERGFTLLEITIALGIFVILFTLTLGIYAASLKAEQRTIQMSKLQKEAQLIMEVVAKKIRSSKINYNYYGGTVDTINGEDSLALLDRSNNQVVFRLGLDSIEVCSSDCQGTGIFNAIPAQDVKVTSLVFFIKPASNPFSLDAPPSEFPKVTMVMNLETEKGGVKQDLSIQQTVPQRLGGI